MGHWRCGRHVCKMPLAGSLCAEGMIIHFKVLPLPHVSRCIAMSLNQKTLQVRWSPGKSLGPGVDVKPSPLLQGGYGAIFPGREFIAAFIEYLHSSFQIREIQTLNLPEIGFSGSVSQWFGFSFCLTIRDGFPPLTPRKLEPVTLGAEISKV